MSKLTDEEAMLIYKDKVTRLVKEITKLHKFLEEIERCKDVPDWLAGDIYTELQRSKKYVGKM